MSLARSALNTLHAVAAAAPHLNVTRAGEERCVTPAAINPPVTLREAPLGKPQVLRRARGPQLSDEGALLQAPRVPAFAQIDNARYRLEQSAPRERLPASGHDGPTRPLARTERPAAQQFCARLHARAAP